MASIMAALLWAESMEWLDRVPRIKPVRTSKLRHARGRPVTAEAFDAMRAVVADVVGRAAAASWDQLLRGLWESGLRLGELMAVQWTDRQQIVPAWETGRLPVLAIPANRQKNAVEESINLRPGFEAILLETPEGDRHGWVFSPASPQTRVGRKARTVRPDAEWVGKEVSKIGKAAGVAVRAAGRGKWASAYDLRRSLAEGLYAAGVPERVIVQVLRHASAQTTQQFYAPVNVRTQGGRATPKLVCLLLTQGQESS